MYFSRSEFGYDHNARNSYYVLMISLPDDRLFNQYAHRFDHHSKGHSIRFILNRIRSCIYLCRMRKITQRKFAYPICYSTNLYKFPYYNYIWQWAHIILLFTSERWNIEWGKKRFKRNSHCNIRLRPVSFNTDCI